MAEHPISHIAVLDFGSQVAALIARRLRERGIDSRVYPSTVDASTLCESQPSGVILSGGPENVAKRHHDYPAVLDEMDVPVLGICYGMQLLCQHFGGKVSTRIGQFGKTTVHVIDHDCAVLKGNGVGNDFVAWMSHGDEVDQLPDGWTVAAESETHPHVAVSSADGRRIGLQFHPEVSHTVGGTDMLERFARQTCGMAGSTETSDRLDIAIRNVQELIGDEEAVIGLSGGVDSAVATAICVKAGVRVHPVAVDTGLLRQDELALIRGATRAMGVKLDVLDASKAFFAALHGVSDPETKRKIIGRLFVETFQEWARQRQPKPAFLVQGTIYSDVIESAGDGHGSHSIKSHHNVGGLPEEMELRLCEPLRKLFKDEVRDVGRLLGLPEELLMRHPFPGPGLAVRLPGEVTKERADTLRQADAIFMEELYASGWHQKVAQAFAVLLPVKSVAVKGDARLYGQVVSLRAVVTDDFMTASWAQLPHDLLSRVARRIGNECVTVSRVLYDISDKPPATVEWE